MSKCISNRGEYSEHTFTHNPECDYCGELPASRFEAMRAAMVAIQELHRMVPCEPDCCDEGLCWTCADTYPCPTRKLADEALGGGEGG